MTTIAIALLALFASSLMAIALTGALLGAAGIALVVAPIAPFRVLHRHAHRIRRLGTLLPPPTPQTQRKKGNPRLPLPGNGLRLAGP